MLWRNLQPRLLRYLRVLGRDDADDIASETWLQVVRDMDRFRGSSDDFRRWLFTVGRHRAIDAARSRLRRRVSATPLDADGLADDQLVEDQVLDGLSVRHAIKLLSRLPREQADAVALRVIAGLETAAVAGVLGKSPGAVRVSLHRGLRTLADDPGIKALAAQSPGWAGRAGGGTAPGGKPGKPEGTDPGLRTLEEVD